MARRMIRKTLRALWSGFGCVSRRPWAAALLCAFLSFAGSAAYALLVRWPEPSVHDEFSYLLGADTLRHGRLTTTPHPMWRFFESFQILQQPTYASKYPPAQAMVIAAGWWLAGDPVVGVWLGGALMTAAVWWMLRGFLPPRWALVGGLITAAHFGMTSYWTHSFWGGCVPAAGGALFAGALPRIRRLDRLRDPFVLGLGLSILANSRPFEGLMVVAIATFVLVPEAIRRARKGGVRSLSRLVVPAAAVLLPALAWTAFYNRAVIGDPLKLPYFEHERQYAVAPPMIWLPARATPTYRHETMREFWTDTNFKDYAAHRDLRGFLALFPKRALALWRFYLGPFLTIGLLGLPWFLRRRWAWMALSSVLLLFAACLGETYALAHYVSPGLAWGALLVTGGFRELFHLRMGGLRLGTALVIGVVLMVIARPVNTLLTLRLAERDWRRAGFIAELEADGRSHLVIVRYGPHHTTHSELVYNAADIDASRVVWARDMGLAENRPLLDYFNDRKAWLLEVDFDGPIRATPYPR